MPCDQDHVPARLAVYPGSFDPVTNGHLDIIWRAAALFDEVCVAVLDNTGKTPLLPVEERVRLIEQSVQAHPRIRVDHFSGLLVDYLALCGSSIVVRGIRDAADLSSEWQMAALNRDLRPSTETVFLPSRISFAHVSSSRVREIAALGGNVSRFVPAHVAARLRIQ